MERLLCKLDAQSPILSDAEVSMEQELSQLPAKLQALHCRIEEVKTTRVSMCCWNFLVSVGKG